VQPASQLKLQLELVNVGQLIAIRYQLPSYAIQLELQLAVFFSN